MIILKILEDTLLKKKNLQLEGNDLQYRNKFFDDIFGLIKEDYVRESFGSLSRNKYSQSINPFEDTPNQFIGNGLNVDLRDEEKLQKLIGRNLGFIHVSYNSTSYIIGTLKEVRKGAMDMVYYIEGVEFELDRDGDLLMAIGQIKVKSSKGWGEVSSIYELKDIKIIDKIESWAKKNGVLRGSDYDAIWYDKDPRSYKQEVDEIASIVSKGIIAFLYSGLNVDQIQVSVIDNGKFIYTEKFPHNVDINSKLDDLKSKFINFEVFDISVFKYSVFQEKWYKEKEPQLKIRGAKVIKEWKDFKGKNNTLFSKTFSTKAYTIKTFSKSNI